MPLLKRKPFSLLEPPNDLDPKEKIFQIRFTKEIFRDYQEYLKRLNLYRERVWTCKVSGKSNLTYEEALVSEHNAMEKAQKLPAELMAHVLRMTQYSTLCLNELVNKIYASLQEEFFEGIELHAKKDGSEEPCKILKILDSGDSKMYEVGWFGRNKTVTNVSVVKAADLIQRRAPVSRNTLRIFIRDATSQSAPWIIHEHLSKKYGIPNEPPKDILYNEGLRKRGRKQHDDETTEDGGKKLKRGNTDLPVKYPIDDLLIRPGDDPAWSKRPPLATDFRVPGSSVGDLLMVWDFCMSFGRLLKLSPFSLTDLENAICHKENSALLVELHAAIFHLLIKDQGDYFTILKNKKRKLKVRSETWGEYLCDFLEMTKIEDLVSNISTVKRGYYGLIDTDMKLKILRELVEEAVTTSAIRELLIEQVNQKQALVATRRGSIRAEKEEQNLNPETGAENEKTQKDGVQDGGGTVEDQVRGTEVDRNNNSRGKTDGKRHLVSKLDTEYEKLSIRSNPLGKDRHYNRYWFFRREGRLFVENADSGEWGYYNTKHELDALMGSLNVKGIRERALKRQLEKLYSKISNALEKVSKDIARKVLLEEGVLRRSTRVRAQPKDNPSMAFLKYVNKWKDHARPKMGG